MIGMSNGDKRMGSFSNGTAPKFGHPELGDDLVDRVFGRRDDLTDCMLRRTALNC